MKTKPAYAYKSVDLFSLYILHIILKFDFDKCARTMIKNHVQGQENVHRSNVSTSQEFATRSWNSVGWSPWNVATCSEYRCAS